MIPPPLLELFIVIGRLPREAVTGVITRDAGRIITLVVGGETDVIEVDAVQVKVVHQIHGNIDGVLEDQRVARVKGLVADHLP